jgi:hypothetical protein
MPKGDGFSLRYGKAVSKRFVHEPADAGGRPSKDSIALCAARLAEAAAIVADVWPFAPASASSSQFSTDASRSRVHSLTDATVSALPDSRLRTSALEHF